MELDRVLFLCWQYVCQLVLVISFENLAFFFRLTRTDIL